MALKIAFIGDRGIPARYSGFSTLTEEVSVRLVSKYGHKVTVYCRKPYFEEHPPTYKGVNLVWLSAPGGKSFESIIHSNIAICHASIQKFDVVFVMDPGNGPFCLPLKLLGVPVLYHTDGLGWKRTKWGPLQRKYYKWSEYITARLASWLVTDSDAMVQYYKSEYNSECSFIPYGSFVGSPPNKSVLDEYNLSDKEFYLIVARMEPENNTALLISEYKKSNTTRPLVIVGSVPYESPYVKSITEQADERVKIIGSVFDSGKLNALYASCYAYLHGHEVGGTNPSLLRAMGAGAPSIVVNVAFNTEVVGPNMPAFDKTEGSLTSLLNTIDSNKEQMENLRTEASNRANELYRWDAVSEAYSLLFESMVKAKKENNLKNELRGRTFYFPESHSDTPESWS